MNLAFIRLSVVKPGEAEQHVPQFLREERVRA